MSTSPVHPVFSMLIKFRHHLVVTDRKIMVASLTPVSLASRKKSILNRDNWQGVMHSRKVN